MKSYKRVEGMGSPAGIIADAYAELEELAEEVEQWKSGMEGTNLESSERYGMLITAYEELTNHQMPDTDEWPQQEAVIHYSVMVPKRSKRHPSRAIRVANAASKIAAVKEFYEGLDEDHSDIISELEDAANLDIEFPGMFG